MLLVTRYLTSGFCNEVVPLQCNKILPVAQTYLLIVFELSFVFYKYELKSSFLI